MKAIVTGGAGFIGSHLVDKLIERGFKVAVIDDLSSGNEKNLNPQANFYKADIQDGKITTIFEKERPDVVFHYAAQISVAKSLADPVGDAKINIIGGLNILENCKNFKVRKIVFPSSVGIYGDISKLPATESIPADPISPYAIGKFTMEKSLAFYKTKGLDYTVIRYSNVYGPRQSSSGEGGVVSIFVNRLLKGEQPVIYGSGEQTRDFLYVGDAVQGAIKALEAPSGSVYNVSTNSEISVLDLFKNCSQLIGKEVSPVFASVREGEVLRSRVSFTRIKKELGWKPECRLPQGLEKTIKHFEA